MMVENKPIPPSWVRDAVFYQIFPDRFAQSSRVPKPAGLEPWDAQPTFHGFKGGDLLGVLEHLGHLQDLGVNAIYFNPIFEWRPITAFTRRLLCSRPIAGCNAAFFELLRKHTAVEFVSFSTRVQPHRARLPAILPHPETVRSRCTSIGSCQRVPLRAYETDTNPIMPPGGGFPHYPNSTHHTRRPRVSMECRATLDRAGHRRGAVWTCPGRSTTTHFGWSFAASVVRIYRHTSWVKSGAMRGAGSAVGSSTPDELSVRAGLLGLFPGRYPG